MSLEASFKEIRKASTPWCAIRTPDYRAVIKTLLASEEPRPPAVIWDCVLGPVSAEGVPSIGDADTPPSKVLQNATGLPERSILFMVVTDNTFYENPFNVQAISNLRDDFKADTRTLVLLGINPILPDFLSEDIPILDDPLPNEEDHKEAIKAILKEAEKQAETKIPMSEKDLGLAAIACLGMTRFATEEAISRKLTKRGINLPQLNLIRQSVIEQASNNALTFEKESWTFDQIGGLESFKDFMTAIFEGPQKPSVVVRIDEIDKSITAASTGQIADNTGVSQDILKCLLTALEENSWMGLLAVGPPGSGKTLSSICTGNSFNTRCLSFDLGAVKGSLVGESEGKIRRVIDILKTIGGKNVLFMATCNRLDTMPPELLRRFWLGTWFWDLPTKEERVRIWQIQRERYKIAEDMTTPKDDEWTGSDIRNCSRMAWICNSSLIEASKRITLVAKANKLQIEKLRDLAVMSGFRSASQPGAYARPEQQAKRKMQNLSS